MPTSWTKRYCKGAEGLLTDTKLTAHAQATASTYANYVAELLYARVDGRFAFDTGDIRVVMGSDTFGNAATKLPTNGEENALARIRNDSGGVRVSANVPAAASNKQNALVRLGNRADMVAPVWGQVTLIPDEVTKAANGQIILTAVPFARGQDSAGRRPSTSKKPTTARPDRWQSRSP